MLKRVIFMKRYKINIEIFRVLLYINSAGLIVQFLAENCEQVDEL